MTELFQGEVQNRIDTKGRVSVPAGFRRVLEQCDPDFTAGSNTRMSVLYWPNKKCLEVYSVEGMAELADMVKKHPPRSPQREMLSRFLGSGSQQLQLDETGRVVLSEKMRNLAGLSEDVLFVGAIDKFEIWDPQAYEVDFQEKLAQFENFDAPFGETMREG